MNFMEIRCDDEPDSESCPMASFVTRTLEPSGSVSSKLFGLVGGPEHIVRQLNTCPTVQALFSLSSISFI
jgi:hypothetical protein